MKASGIINKIAILTAILFSISVEHLQANPPRYQRASLTQIMIEHPMYALNDEIVEAYKSLPLNPRFNDHSLGVTVVKFATQEYTDQTPYINAFLKKAKVGNRAVAKWFLFNKETGEFSPDLVKERGLYDATVFDKEMATRLVRGNAILEDAGEKLISHTYLIMHDICFKGKYSNKLKDFNATGKKLSFKDNVTSYIYSLDWGIDQLDEFYSFHYDSKNINFVKTANYGYTFRAKVESEYNEESTKISQRDLIRRVVGRCLDKNIAKLQTAYPDFRIMTPISTTDPITANIGLKEGIDENSLFEVLEAEETPTGIIKYKRVGIISPIANKIADNRFMSESADDEFTQFKIVSGKNFYEGMMIREINEK